MGILSTFCVAVVALALDKILSAKISESPVLVEIWKSGQLYVLTASTLMLLGGYFFYRQRSLLAWYYGQICLCLFRSPKEVQDWLDDADSWETWRYYQTAFVLMWLATIDYGAAICSANSSWIQEHYLIVILIPLLSTGPVLLFRRFVLKRYKYEDEPFKVFFSRLRKRT